MTRPYPVSRDIREMLHQEIGRVSATETLHDRLHDGILLLMHRYGLPSGPPIRHKKDWMND